MSNYEVVCGGADRVAWLKARMDGVGSSDAASVLGLNPWASPMAVYVDKHGMGEQDEGHTEPTYWGKAIEPLVLRRFSEEHPKREVKSAQQLLRNIERPWQMCTLDGMQRNSSDTEANWGLLEIKATGLGWRWVDGLPPYVDAQIQHQFAVTGFEWGSLAVLFNGKFWDYKHKDVFPDAERIKVITGIEWDFWRNTERGNPPDADGTDSCTDAIKLIYPEAAKGSVVTLADSFIEKHNERVQVMDELKSLEESKVRLDNEIRMAMGDNETAHLGMSPITYTNKTQTRGGTSFRVLRVKGGAK